MSWLDKSIQQGIERGMAEGLCSVFWKDYGVLTSDAQSVLRDPRCRAKTDKQIGARNALIDLGLVARDWLGRYRATSLGRQIASE
ncbi:hypothetical protein [Mesorhizobium amorphae]|uniref:hypothetical protein n=1 Tax=Mesorhizobium amorphae TaxID=71433 RepID=UPI0011859AC7|nr:hypothetical protein [Mesorhizobium amorphae]